MTTACLQTFIFPKPCTFDLRNGNLPLGTRRSETWHVGWKAKLGLAMWSCNGLLWFVFLVFSEVAISGATSDHTTTAAYEKCNNDCRAEGSGLLVCAVACTQEEQNVRDAELNKIYTQLKERLTGSPFAKELVLRERAWIRQRDRKCEKLAKSEYDNDEDANAGHEAVAAIEQGCLDTETANRRDYLKDALTKLEKNGIAQFHF